jgi:F-type H+-transporting ATPase subunit c
MKAYGKLILALATVSFAIPALAQDATAASVGSSLGYIGLGIGIMMGLAVLGGALGESKAAAAALEGIARNPAAADKFFLPFILSLALIESLVLFAFLISLFLQGTLNKVLAVVFHLPT